MPTTHEMVGEIIPPVGAINECGTCHKEAFCLACHGTPMPHSEEFKEPKDPKDPKGHPVVSKLIPEKCVMCHTEKEPNFCNECHHGTQVDYEYDPAQPWTQQHPKAIAKSGLKSCLGTCHTVPVLRRLPHHRTRCSRLRTSSRTGRIRRIRP